MTLTTKCQVYTRSFMMNKCRNEACYLILKTTEPHLCRFDVTIGTPWNASIWPVRDVLVHGLPKVELHNSQNKSLLGRLLKKLLYL